MIFDNTESRTQRFILVVREFTAVMLAVMLGSIHVLKIALTIQYNQSIFLLTPSSETQKYTSEEKNLTQEKHVCSCSPFSLVPQSFCSVRNLKRF